MRGRLRQFLQAGRTPTPADYEFARRSLAPPLFELFAAQHPRDIVHGAMTARWLLARGHDGQDLLAAALLHDVGKGRQRRADRVAYVLAARLGVAPLLADASSRLEVRRAVARTSNHSSEGAALLAAARASDTVVDLTRRHHQPPGADPVLALLQAADSAS